MKHVYKLFIVFAVIYFNANSALQAQNFQVLDVNKSKDANPNNGGFAGYYDQAYSKFEYAVLNSVSYFAADDGVHGTELWKSDGTAAGTRLLKDINPGYASSNVHDITVSGNKIYFAADDGEDGLELWVTDGTRVNTKMVKDIYDGSVGSSPAYLIDGDGELYFFANNAALGDELWKSDGTEDGTVRIASFFTSEFNYSQYGNQLSYVNGHLFFAMNGGSGFNLYGDEELWTSDGTETGTYLVKQINPNFGFTFLYSLTALNGLLYFSADDGSGRQLWVSDGTYFGTNPVYNPNNIYLYQDAFNNEFNKFDVKDNKLYFSGYTNDNSDGSKLCVYDPSDPFNSPQLIKDFAPGFHSYNLYNLTNVDNNIFFTVYSGTDQTLWKSDGTTDGTMLVKDINPGGRNIYQYRDFHNANGTLLFSFSDDKNEIELWKSDGTDEGTVMIKDINPGIYSSNTVNITYIGNGISLFAANNGNTGLELWRTDNTENGTAIVKNINQSATASSNPADLTLSSDSSILFFTATSPKYGTEMRITDGTQDGTQLLKDIYPGSLNPYNLQLSFFPASTSDATYFFAGIKDTIRTGTSDPFALNRLFKTNGIDHSVKLISAPALYNLIDTYANIESVTTAGNLYYIILYNYGANFQELWRSDGTAAGTFAVKTDIDPYYNLNATAAGNNLFFVNDDGINGLELWKSDGTAAGTALVKDINVGYNSSYPSRLYNFNDKLYFSADYGYGPFLWTSDGTDAGTKIIKSLFVDVNVPFAQANGRLFFSGENAISSGYELYATDGTASGTHLIKDINYGPTSSYPAQLVSGDTSLYFIADDGKHGAELWKSNGTKEGTQLVKNITPGIDRSFFNAMVNVHDKLFFTTNDTLWQSDGTKDGTYKMSDASLDGVSNIGSLKAMRNKLFFSGYSYAVGQELFAAEIPGLFNKTNNTATNISVAKLNTTLEAKLLSNPITDQLRFTVNTKEQQTAQIIVADASGKLLVTEKKILSTGTNIFSYNTKPWMHGMYMIRITTADGSSFLLKAVK